MELMRTMPLLSILAAVIVPVNSFDAGLKPIQMEHVASNTISSQRRAAEALPGPWAGPTRFNASSVGNCTLPNKNGTPPARTEVALKNPPSVAVLIEDEATGSAVQGHDAIPAASEKTRMPRIPEAATADSVPGISEDTITSPGEEGGGASPSSPPLVRGRYKEKQERERRSGKHDPGTCAADEAFPNGLPDDHVYQRPPHWKDDIDERGFTLLSHAEFLGKTVRQAREDAKKAEEESWKQQYQLYLKWRKRIEEEEAHGETGSGNPKDEFPAPVRAVDEGFSTAGQVRVEHAEEAS